MHATKSPRTLPGRILAIGRRILDLPPIIFATVFVASVALQHGQTLRVGLDLTLWLHDLTLRNNLHEVVPGTYFRAAEMDHDDLAEVIADYGIATVIDLRNGLPDADELGRTEPDVVAAAGARYVHVPMLSTNVPPKERLLLLLDTFDHSERPVLVHCSSGALRTGVASVIWMLTQERHSLADARDQLAMRYGYTWLETALRTRANDYDPLVTLLDQYAMSRAPELSFREWVEAGSTARDGAGIPRFFPAEPEDRDHS